MRNVLLSLAGGAAMGLLGACQTLADGGNPVPGCPSIAQWVDPATGELLQHDRVIADMAGRRIVLLGESHDNPEHHRWQLSTMAALYGRNPDVVLAFEAFPRRVQPVLDRWIAGELSSEALLEETGWWDIWGFDPDLYLPLFQFARLHRIPMLAINVDRSLVRKVGEVGWAAITVEERQGVGDPAAPQPAYLEILLDQYLQHPSVRGRLAAPADRAEVMASAEFRRFVDAQLTWDRAMAEALAEAARRPEEPLVVGVIGSGHLRHGYGVPYQLADLGIADVAVLLPYAPSADCAGLVSGLADAVYIVPASADAAREPPRLGVIVEIAEETVRVRQVAANSVAARAGLLAGDVIREAAGRRVKSTSELVQIIRRTAPGTWLPLVVERDGREIEIVARFPAAVE